MAAPPNRNEEFLTPTPAIEAQHAAVRAFAQAQIGGETDTVGRAVRLYYAVRDLIRYDPYSIDLTVDGLKASATLRAGRGWCVAKAILLTACCRASGIPSRLGFADVRNHVTTDRLREYMRTDVFYWHGYTSMLLERRWVKATPAFNLELCRKFRLLPLEFDGRNDALLQPYDAEGRRHLEYLRYRGEFADVPLAAIISTFRRRYPQVGLAGGAASFEGDVDREASG